MDNQTEIRKSFEERCFSDFFIKSISFKEGKQFASCTNVSSAELFAKDENDQYIREDISAMWHGWKLANKFYKTN